MKPDTAAQQLRRVLALIPRIADDRAHPVADLARLAGTDPATLLRDVRALADRFDDPGAFVEAVRIFLDGRRVRVTTDHFRRPMRLTLPELAALDLGLALLRAERPREEWPALDRARARLDQAMAKVPRDEGEADSAAAGLHAGVARSADPAVLATLRRAYQGRQKVELDYRKADQTEPSRRVVAPLAIVFSSGHWYLVAQWDPADGVRVFRVDRVVSATVLAERYQLPAGFAVEEVFKDGKAFAAPGEATVRIRFSSRVARWIAERDGGAVDGDGGYTQELPLADLDWLARYVMQYGPEAEVLEPAAARAAVRERLERVAALVPAAAEGAA